MQSEVVPHACSRGDGGGDTHPCGAKVRQGLHGTASPCLQTRQQGASEGQKGVRADVMCGCKCLAGGGEDAPLHGVRRRPGDAVRQAGKVAPTGFQHLFCSARNAGVRCHVTLHNGCVCHAGLLQQPLCTSPETPRLHTHHHARALIAQCLRLAGAQSCTEAEGYSTANART